MSEKIIITFPDGNKKEVDKGINGLELASQISKSLAKESVAIKINNDIKDISLPINSDASVAILKRDSEEALELIRHDCAHVMAEAVQELFPEHKLQLVQQLKMVFIMILQEMNLLLLQIFQKLKRRCTISFKEIKIS